MAEIIEEQNLDGGDIDEQLIHGNEWVAQSFTIGTTGDNFEHTVSKVRLEMRKIGTLVNDLTIEIHESNPEEGPVGGAISTGTLAKADVGSENKVWIEISMSEVVLVKGRKYVLICYTTSGDASNAYKWDASIGSSVYSGGTNIISSDAGKSWVTQTGDNVFQIIGTNFSATMATYSEASQKLGANASSISSNEEILENFIKQAESVVNATTRFNWTDEYTTLTEEVKKILTDFVTNRAAIFAISFDMSGFSSRAEAETMINVYREQNEILIKLLSDQERKRFIKNDQ